MADMGSASWSFVHAGYCESGLSGLCDVGMSRSRVTELQGALPYWLETVLLNHLDLRTYIVSEREVSEVASYLTAHGKEVTLDALMPLLGQQHDATRRLFKYWVSLQQYASMIH